MKGKNGERLEGEVRKLKPDLWWWQNNNLYIVEFTIPYGTLSDHDSDERRSTLETRRKQKENKYKELVESCERQFNCSVTFLVIIVSSLGAIPKDTMKDLKKLVKNKRKLDILCRRMVATTLRESMFIFYNWNYKDMRKERNNAIYSTSSSEDNTNENNYSDILDDNGTVPLWNDNDNDDENVSNVSDND